MSVCAVGAGGLGCSALDSPGSEPLFESRSPCGAPGFDARALVDLPLDSDGAILGEPFPTEAFVELDGVLSSMSDDGRFVVTCSAGLASDAPRAHVADLVSGETHGIAMTPFSECPTISGDGTTLLYDEQPSELVSPLEPLPSTLYAIDVETSERRALTRGLLRGASISDDARQISFAACVDAACSAYEPRRLDVSSGDERAVGPSGAPTRLFSPVLSGDGRSLAYTRYAGDGLSLVGEGVIRLGEAESTFDDMLLATSRMGMSSDGCEVLSTRAVFDYSGHAPGDPPILDLAWVVDGVRLATGSGDGRANVRVWSAALSGDGGTGVVFHEPGGRTQLSRIRMFDGRVQTMEPRCSGYHALVSDDGAVIAMHIDRCDGETERRDRTRVFQLGAW